MAISALPDTLEEWRDTIHPAALLLPRLAPSDYDSLKASIEERGVLQPLATWVDLNGDIWLIDGVSRLQAMVELNMHILDDKGGWDIDNTRFFEEKGDDPYAVALSLNIARRHLTPEQRRQVIRDLREQRPDLSDRAVARMAGVSPHTVAAERREHDEPDVEEPEEEPDIDEPDVEEPEEEPDIDEPETEEGGEPQRGRRTRGQRQRGTREDHETPVVPVTNMPFVGTVLPNAPKNTRIAEGRRCLKHLRLQIDDLLPKSRRETMH